MRTRYRDIPTTTLVVDALRSADDFLTAGQLTDRTRRSVHRVTSALIYLRSRGVVEPIPVPASTLHWYLTGEDRRQVVRERVLLLPERARRIPPGR